jgi:hypothetical protein
LDHFLDRALTRDEMRPAREHLEDCGACSRQDRFEALVPRAVRDQLCRLGAPQLLVQRVCHGNFRQCRAVGLGLVFALNVLDAGGAESGRSGYTFSRWALSRNEVRCFGLVLAANPCARGFFLRKYEDEEASHLADPELRSTRAHVVRMAANRLPAPCRIH